MTKLSKNSKFSALMNWKLLFDQKNKMHSDQTKDHWKHVKQLGIPSYKSEQWKNTPLHRLLENRFDLPSNKVISKKRLDDISIGINAYRLVFVNGCFSKTLSDSDTGMWKIVIQQSTERSILPKPIQSEFFLHLTESLSQETTRIYLPTGKIEKKPLYLLHISQGSVDKDALSALYYRHHIEVDTNSEGHFFEHFISLNNASHFSCTRTTMQIHDNACFSHTKLISENNSSYHFSHNDIVVKQNGIVCSTNFIFGSSLARQNTSIQLNGKGSDLSVNSLLLPFGKSFSENHTYLEHNKDHCKSRQLHKIITRDYSIGIFEGLIKVAKYALQSDGKMINKNMLIDSTTKINSKPQLEIYSDDVKCSHSATMGNIDYKQVFYMRSRGITKKNAQQMIIYAFASEVTEVISNKSVSEKILMRIANSLQEE